MKTIPLTRGYFAMVDDADYESLSKHKWTVAVRKYTAYAVRDDKKRRVYMHRLIMSNPAQHVDHIDCNGLNNTRANLRLSTKAQNGHNRGKSETNKSGYKGVSWSKQVKKWTVFIRVNNAHLHVGHFKDVAEAARAYDAAAIKYHGEFAYTNFPKGRRTVTANKTTEPRIVNVEYTPSKTWHTIKMTTAARAIVTWSNGSRTVLHDDEARSMYRRWQREREVVA